MSLPHPSAEASLTVQQADTAEALRLDANFALAHYNIGLLLSGQGQPEEALRHFDLAIETDPSNASFYLNNKASALTQIGLHDKARAIYAQILDRKDLSKETQRIVIKRVADMKNAGSSKK